jgi:hypothetical protein
MARLYEAAQQSDFRYGLLGALQQIARPFDAQIIQITLRRSKNIVASSRLR